MRSLDILKYAKLQKPYSPRCPINSYNSKDSLVHSDPSCRSIYEEPPDATNISQRSKAPSDTQFQSIQLKRVKDMKNPFGMQKSKRGLLTIYFSMLS